MQGTSYFIQTEQSYKMKTTFKFLQRPKEYFLHIQQVKMFRATTIDSINQDTIDMMNKTIEPFILEPNTLNNRNHMMELLTPFFQTIESIYDESI